MLTLYTDISVICVHIVLFLQRFSTFQVLLVNRAAPMHTKEETIAVLKQFDIGNKFSFLPVLPKASVLIPLFVKNGQLQTLMTLRSKEVT